MHMAKHRAMNRAYKYRARGMHKSVDVKQQSQSVCICDDTTTA